MAWEDLTERLVDSVFRTFDTVAEYTPPDGDPVTLATIFDQVRQSVGISESGTAIESIVTSLEIRARELAEHGVEDIMQGASFLIRGTSYLVHNVEGPDHDGVLRVTLHLADHA